MIQFQYDGVMKRYNVKVPFTLAGESSMVTVAAISEDSKITLHRDLSIKLLHQILLHWDEYEYQMSRELDELFNDQECKHHMNPETCISCEEDKTKTKKKGDK